MSLICLFKLTFLFLSSSLASPARNDQEHQLLITVPPDPEGTSCPNAKALKRQESCEYGDCGGSCLAQGAFCCGPAGTLATSPRWMCDNGACITSVRGTTGIVDCYDPDNPAGTTQSCIDHVPTTTCKPTDRCYTCLPAQPYCRWETYIDTNSPTLSWFSCVETKLADATFLAATITSPTRPPSPALENGGDDNGTRLSTGAIVGIVVGGGTGAIIAISILVYFCLKRRKQKTSPPLELSGNPVVSPMVNQIPMELDSGASARNELQNTTYLPHSQTEISFSPPDDYARTAEEAYKWRRGSGVTPVELQAQKSGYFLQSPGELRSETAEQRRTRGCGDEQAYINATRRF